MIPTIGHECPKCGCWIATGEEGHDCFAKLQEARSMIGRAQSATELRNALLEIASWGKPKENEK